MHQPDEKQIITHKQTAAFAAKYIAPRADLQTGQEFPMDIWQEMGKAGLFQIGIAKTHGGAGGGYLELLKAGEAFVESGGNVGLAVSWLYQQIIARFILGTFATPAQRRQYLRPAARGEIILSFAVSEPGHGAHPKLLNTSATKDKTGYVLAGEKTYLTNGPIADIFIVIAVTDDTISLKRELCITTYKQQHCFSRESGNPVLLSDSWIPGQARNDAKRGCVKVSKSFTAFLVPRTAYGVIVTPPMALNFLKPSPHGGVKLEDCFLGQKSVLGKEGNAWPDLVVPFGEIEDVVMMGPALGGMAAEITMLIGAIREHQTETNRTLREELGALHALMQTLRIVAYEAANLLDRSKVSPTPLAITFARLAAEFQTGIARVQEEWKIAPPDPYADLQRDMQSLGSLKKKLLQIRQEKIGAALLKP